LLKGAHLEPPPDLESRVLGCLIGCAVGDALGAPFEGYWDHQLPGRKALLRGFAEVEGYPRGQFTDDTQLTLATVESIVKRGSLEPGHVAHSIALLWKHQSVVGPGGACSFAANAFLKSHDWKTCGAPPGQAGNGTAMRTAALGLYFLSEPERLPDAVAEVSCITHQDPRSVAGGIAIAQAAHFLATSESIDAETFCASIADSIRTYESVFAGLINDLPARLQEDRDTAIAAIAWAGSPAPEFSRPVITPFVVPTVLAALWVVLRNPSSWPNAVVEVIQLGGDVDTLGAIVGALMGTRLGISAIPEHLVVGVLRSAEIQRLARQYHRIVAARGR
jgi:ADP-ribosylglycohydrolase